MKELWQYEGEVTQEEAEHRVREIKQCEWFIGYHSPTACPVCGSFKNIFVRLGYHICINCVSVYTTEDAMKVYNKREQT